jgi:hypothetical protein
MIRFLPPIGVFVRAPDNLSRPLERCSTATEAEKVLFRSRLHPTLVQAPLLKPPGSYYGLKGKF